MRRTFLYYASAIILALLFCGCDESENVSNDENVEEKTPEVEALSIALNMDSLYLFTGATDTLKATVKKGEKVVDFNVIWQSDNVEVAVVDSNGVITALSIGTAVISAKIEDLTAECFVTVDRPNENGYDFVDLGLSVKWATRNIGAENPEDYGYYIAWGETATKSTFYWDNYRFYVSGEGYSGVEVSKYYVNNKTFLDPEDDAANVIWGGNWRMPTQAEMKELIDNCTWTKTILNGINGYLVTSKKAGYTDRSIYFPAAGSLVYDQQVSVGSVCYYWTNQVGYQSCHAIYLSYGPIEGLRVDNSVPRYYGHTVRAVCP